MEKPNPESIALGDEMFYLRGKIITGYAQVEFFLADLSVKLNVKFPFKIKDRIKAAKEIADRPGYSEYREELHELCDQLARYDNIRHFMAHGGRIAPRGRGGVSGALFSAGATSFETALRASSG